MSQRAHGRIFDTLPAHANQRRSRGLPDRALVAVVVLTVAVAAEVDVNHHLPLSGCRLLADRTRMTATVGRGERYGYCKGGGFVGKHSINTTNFITIERFELPKVTKSYES